MGVERKPRLVLLSQYFYPEENTTSWLMSQLGFALADDFEVVAVAGHLTYHEGSGRDAVPPVLKKDGVEVLRVASTRLNRQSTLGRVVNTATFTLSTMAKLLLLPRPDVILAVTNPPLLHWIAALVGRLRGIPVVLLIHDQYPEIVAALGKLPADSSVLRLWKILTGWAYRNAATIVSLGRCMTDLLRREYSRDVDGRIVTIPNWDDGDKIRPVAREDNPLLDEWGLRDRFVVLYAGNIGLFHEIKTVVDAAEALRGSEIEFVFVGDGGQGKWLAEQITTRQLDNVRVLPFRPKEEMPLVLTACDAGLITLKDEATGLCVPSKLYGTLASGKPILCVMNPASETAQAVLDARSGAVVPPGHPDEVAAVLREWAGDRERVRSMGENSRIAFESKYGQRTVTGLYRDVLMRVLKPNRTDEG